MSDNSAAKAEAATRCYLVVVTAGREGDAPAAWLPPGAPEWRLPAVDIAGSAGFTGDAESIRQAMAAELDLDGHVLCHLLSRRPGDGAPREQVVVVEADRATIPIAWRPVSAEDVLTEPFAVPEHRDLLCRWLRQSAPGAVPAERVAWARPGWRPRAEAWINRQLAGMSLTLTEPITARKIWSISCVLRVPTRCGEFYFKAVPPLFGREPALTNALARRHPGQVPEVVALEPAEGWMLMRGFTGTELRQVEDLAIWEEALRAYARLQIAWRDDLDALRRLGCPDRGPLRLAEQIDEILADDALMMVGQPRGLTEDQVAELRALAPRFKAACAEWAVAGIPLTLEHGDYHAENVVVSNGQFIVFDWTDGCIAHPFVCLPTLLENANPAWHEALTRAYLESWGGFASQAQLDTAVRLARPLGVLHQAVSYFDIHHAGEPMVRWQLNEGAPYFLREVMKYQSHMVKGQ